MSIKHALLGLLAERPLHGYELKAAYDTELSPGAPLNFGQVYTTLERLARDGLVACELVSQAERPDKKVYALTDEGRRQLRVWLAEPARQDLGLRDDAYLKLVFARRLRIDPVKIVAAERRGSFARLHEVTQARAQAEKQGAPPLTVLRLDLATFRLEAFLKWLDRCEEVLRRENKR